MGEWMGKFIRFCFLLGAVLAALPPSAHTADLAGSHTRPLSIGFNQAWFHNHYAYQYLDGSFNADEAVRIFRLAKSAGAKTVRLWFFEGLGFPMLEWQGEDLRGLRPDFIRNVVHTLELARREGVQVYMTLLDAQVYRQAHHDAAVRSRFKRILSRVGFRLFLERAVRPLFHAINEAGVAGVISRVDLMNEADVAVDRAAFEGSFFGGGWREASRFLCQGREAIRTTWGFERTPVSFSVRLSWFLPLPSGFFDEDGPMACADFFDFHSYSDSGRIDRCHWVKHHSLRDPRPVILGEFGQSYFTAKFDDDLQAKVTRNYLESAKEWGFREALAWRLSDIRPGFNPEARYSFEGSGRSLRPAFEVLRAYSASHAR
jgi:hypothetical protein